ncbi:hypothetical protein TNCV_214991 [Trichonephila clavipes]|nr:hypothetical protein TNCV_214991 [Trichonephila clavipes]
MNDCEISLNLKIVRLEDLFWVIGFLENVVGVRGKLKFIQLCLDYVSEKTVQKKGDVKANISTTTTGDVTTRKRKECKCSGNLRREDGRAFPSSVSEIVHPHIGYEKLTGCLSFDTVTKPITSPQLLRTPRLAAKVAEIPVYSLIPGKEVWNLVLGVTRDASTMRFVSSRSGDGSAS